MRRYRLEMIYGGGCVSGDNFVRYLLLVLDRVLGPSRRAAASGAL